MGSTGGGGEHTEGDGARGGVYPMDLGLCPQPAWVVDVATLSYVDVNTAATELFGMSREEMIGRSITLGQEPEVAIQLEAKRGSLGETSSQGSWKLRRKDGTARFMEVISIPMPGTPVRRLCLARDITGVRQTVDALWKSQRRFARLQDAGTVGIVIGDYGGLIREANDAFLKLVGYSREELARGEVRFDTLTPADWRPLTASVHDQLRTESVAHPVEKEYMRKDGTRVPVLITAASLDERDHITVVVDLTGRKQAEHALRRSESLFRAIVETSPLGVTLMDAENKLLYVSRAAAALAGMAAEEMLGKRMADLPVVDDRDEYLAKWRECVGEPGVARRVPMIARRGDEIRHIESVRTNHLEDPNLRAVVTLVSDLTDQRRLEQQLRQAHKMEAIGNLAGGIAHDFNNLLTVILSYSEVLQGAVDPADPAHADLGEIRRAAERAAALTRQLLAFGRRQILSPRVLDLDTTLDDLSKLFRRVLGESIELVLHRDADLDNVVADPTQIEQVLMNLVVNARDAMPRGGTLTIATGNVTLDEAAAAALPGAEPGLYVLLSVSDTGTGMDAETQARIFEPFFTTKKELGTGLGLATVFGIVQQSGGAVAVESAPGQGTTFKVYLPATVEAESVPRATNVERSDVRGTETILLAEDEDQVRDVIREVLRRCGYHVLEARNAGEALLHCERFSGAIHLLLTDVVMPQMSGRELADRLSAVRPDMRVLCMSGYSDDSNLYERGGERAVVLLAKPLTPDILLRKVREVLDGGPRPAGPQP